MTAPDQQTTVVVFCHNYGRYLRQAVDSVLGQTRRPRILILDDASEDETRAVAGEIVAAAAGAVEYRRTDTNLGLSRARNLAAATVTTDWIVHLDADDWLAPTFIESGEEWLRTHGTTEVLTTDMVVVREGQPRNVVRARAPRCWTDLAQHNTVITTAFIRRSVILQLGGYDPALHFEDWDFWIRVVKAGYRIERLPGPHLFRREHGLNKSKVCDQEEGRRQIRAKHPTLTSFESHHPGWQ